MKLNSWLSKIILHSIYYKKTVCAEVKKHRCRYKFFLNTHSLPPSVVISQQTFKRFPFFIRSIQYSPSLRWEPAFRISLQEWSKEGNADLRSEFPYKNDLKKEMRFFLNDRHNLFNVCEWLNTASQRLFLKCCSPFVKKYSFGLYMHMIRESSRHFPLVVLPLFF